MLDLESLQELIEGRDYNPLFVTVSGAHLYGFPSPDSDVDLRGCHQLPLRDIVGIDRPKETLEWETDHDGTEIELVSHDIGKYLRLFACMAGTPCQHPDHDAEKRSRVRPTQHT